MNKKLLFAASGAALFFATVPIAEAQRFQMPTPQFSQSYAALAAGHGGWQYSTGSTMENARANAVNGCRQSGYGSCSASVAESHSWAYAVGYCYDTPYVGASPQGEQRAREIVFIKAAADGYSYRDCYIETSYGPYY